MGGPLSGPSDEDSKWSRNIHSGKSTLDEKFFWNWPCTDRTKMYTCRRAGEEISTAFVLKKAAQVSNDRTRLLIQLSSKVL